MTPTGHASLLSVAACVLAALPGTASAGNPVFWPEPYAQEQVYAKYSSQVGDVACAGVGPYALQHGTKLFGELACDLYTDTGDYVLAVVPTGAKTWRMLNAGQTSPVSGPLRGIAGAGAPHQVALLDYPSKRAVVLDDQSTWKVVDPLGRMARWKHGDSVVVEPGRTAKHFYRVVNKSRGDSLEADFLGFA